MPPFQNPALDAFVTRIGEELVFAQLLIRRGQAGFELRQVSDRERTPEALRNLQSSDLLALAQFTAQGAFRPLKSAPNLQSGWRFTAADEAALELAVNQLYPGAIAGWFAALSPAPPITHYREFTGRQTGMYRITALLSDIQVAQVARAGCHKDFCLKRRLWTIEGLAPDAPAEKSLIPCLEPCALLLEFARKAMRIEQEEKISVELSPSDIATVASAVRTALEHPGLETREGDFSAPVNPRRLRLVLEKLPKVTLPPGGPERE